MASVLFPAGTTKTLTVKATLAGTGIHTFSIASASSVGTNGATVSGSFPMIGNSLSLTTAVTLGTVTVAKYSTLSDVEIGSANALISKIKLTQIFMLQIPRWLLIILIR